MDSALGGLVGSLSRGSNLREEATKAARGEVELRKSVYRSSTPVQVYLGSSVVGPGNQVSQYMLYVQQRHKRGLCSLFNNSIVQHKPLPVCLLCPPLPPLCIQKHEIDISNTL